MLETINQFQPVKLPWPIPDLCVQSSKGLPWQALQETSKHRSSSGNPDRAWASLTIHFIHFSGGHRSISWCFIHVKYLCVFQSLSQSDPIPYEIALKGWSSGIKRWTFGFPGELFSIVDSTKTGEATSRPGEHLNQVIPWKWSWNDLAGRWKSITGWWLKNHLEKYEFVNGKDDIPFFEMENKSHVPNHQPDDLVSF